MLPILQIGPLALPTPALLLLLGFWIALDLTEKQAHQFGADARQIYNMTLAAVLAGLVGARLVYAASVPTIFLENPLDLLAPRPQMLDATGGAVVGLLAAFVYGWLRKLPLWPTLDAAATLFSVLAVTLGLAHFASGEAFGTPASLPWSIDLWASCATQPRCTRPWPRWRSRRSSGHMLPGRAAALRAIPARGPASVSGSSWRSARRHGLILETFRGDSVLVWNAFRQAQLVAWPVLAAGLWQIGRRLEAPAAAPKGKTRKKEHPEMSLDGKTILITGAARRIGRHLALTVASAGADVVLHHAHSSTEANQVAAEIERMGRRAWVVQADFARPAEAEGPGGAGRCSVSSVCADQQWSHL